MMATETQRNTQSIHLQIFVPIWIHLHYKHEKYHGNKHSHRYIWNWNQVQRFTSQKKMKILTFSTRRQNSLNGVLDETTTANTRGRSSRAHARCCKFTSGSRPSSSRRPILRSLFLPRTTGYEGCWLAGKTRGRNERCYGDLRPPDDALARAAGTPPRTKCISFKCSFIRFLCIRSHWDN